MPHNYFTSENPKTVINTSGQYGIIPAAIDATQIEDGLTETDRGAGLVKLGSSMPSPLARLFLFSAALREINSYEGKSQGKGHIGIPNANTKEYDATAYHDLVGELLDMLEFVFQYGDKHEFKVQTWDLNNECTALAKSPDPAHHKLASALRSAFGFGVINNQPIHLFKWKGVVIGGTSPISLVYTSANLRTVVKNLGQQFNGIAGNILFNDGAVPLHARDKAFREYLYRLILTDFQTLPLDTPLAELKKYIQDSGANYDSNESFYQEVLQNPKAYNNVKNLSSQDGANVMVAGVQLRVSDHNIPITPSTSDYIIKPTTNVYQQGNAATHTPMVLTKHGIIDDDKAIYAEGRPWNEDSDKIPQRHDTIPINNRILPGLGVPYPYLTVDDFFDDKVIEVSYNINKAKFFTGCGNDINFLLPLKREFFKYFSLSDLIDGNGNYTNMLKVDYDKTHNNLTIDLTIPLCNGHTICLKKSYDVGENSTKKVNCYDAVNTFDLAFFPFYRLEPDIDKNVYNVMLGASINGVSMKFYEPTAAGLSEVNFNSGSKLTNQPNQPNQPIHRTVIGNTSSLATDHICVNGAFSFCELSLDGTTALVIPLFKRIDSNAARAQNHFTFAIDFGTTNTHVAYAKTQPNMPIGQPVPFDYNDADTQMVMFNDVKTDVAEFVAFKTAVKRELVPTKIGADNASVKFPMRTATYQAAGNPQILEMFHNTNIGFNYGADISHSENYKTNIKWDRFDILSQDRMSTFFAQMLWMMKNKSVLNDGSVNFDLVVTYPFAMRKNDFVNFQNAWNDAKATVQCNVNINYCTESVAPYYSYLVNLKFGQPYANMDIGGGTTDFLYVNPKVNQNDHVFSVFFAADDLWNDGIEIANRPYKANGFIKFYNKQRGQNLGNKSAELNDVIATSMSSADIVNYLFTNNSWTRFFNTIQTSPDMMQLPLIHFSALTFYMAYALHLAGVEIPKVLSFTGMGSKYIKLISSAEADIAKIATAIFQYAGEVLGNDKLKSASVKVIFADNPKELTAIGALISQNYNEPISPSQDTYFGYEGETLGKTISYNDITDEVQNSVIKLFEKFTSMFNDPKIISVFNPIGCNVSKDVIAQLIEYAEPSLLQMKAISVKGQDGIFNEPMFFWPLKNALYEIGKELADN